MRKSFLFRLILFFTLLLPAYISAGQEISDNNRLFFEQPYTLQRADLSLVHCIFKDSHHIMWFGTENGLYRYDGVNTRYFGHRTGDSTSLSSYTVLGIAEDKNGQLWVSLLNGVAEIDLNTLKCKTYTVTDSRYGGGNYTNRICIDDSGNVWVGNNGGVFLFDKKKQCFTNVWNNNVQGYALSNYVTYLTSINRHLLAVSTFHDLILLNKDDHSFTRVPVFIGPPPKDSTTTFLLFDSKQKLWVGTWGGGLYQYDLETKRLTHVNNLQPIYSIPHFYITSLYETAFNKQRCIWISASVGIVKCILDSADNVSSYTFIGHDNNSNHSIIPTKIEALYTDNNGALWCGGDAGVCKCFPFQNNFKLFALQKGLIQDIQQIKMNAGNYYFIDSWNSTLGLGCILTDSSGRVLQHTIDPHFTDKDDGKNISGIVKDKLNRFWISSMAGVSVLNEKYEVVKQWNKDTKGENNLTYYRTSGITIHNDTIWVICYHRGIDLFDMSFKKIRHYSISDKCGLDDNLEWSFLNDSKGNLWICGNSKLYKYLPRTGRFLAYAMSSELNGCGPREAVETANGDLVIASALGLIQFNPRSEKYTYIRSEILQKEQGVNSAAIDKNGAIWFLTDKHLVKYESKENRFILFGKEDGLDVTKGINELRTFNGTDFYLCQEDQVIKFNCDSLSQPATPPYLELSIQVDDSNTYSSISSNDLFLPYNKNKLQFEFTGISYIKADQNQYYYQLSDVDKQWNTTYKNAVSYANLAPGNYSFKVKTLNYAGMWSDEKDFHFTITPPYWQTWWFRSISITFILSIFFLVIRYISQRNLKERILRLEKETAVEKERNRIAQDMHDDLGSGLTKIAILSEVVKTKIKHPEEASVQLESISSSSRTLVDNLQDIVWMLNTKHDRLDTLVIYVREYATKYFEQSDISVSFDYPAHIEPFKLREEQRRNIFMAIKESLHNIVKHAEANAVKISFSTEKNMLTFTVSDNGKGFEMEGIRKFANGLKNMQNRMEQTGGSYSITSVLGKGTTVIFSLSL